MAIFSHTKKGLTSSHKSLKGFWKVSGKYQHTFIILFFILRLRRFTVETLTFISSAHRSSGISLHRMLKSCISESVKLHSRKQYSISGFVKLHTFKNATYFFFFFAVPLLFPFFLVLLRVILVFAIVYNLQYAFNLFCRDVGAYDIAGAVNQGIHS